MLEETLKRALQEALGAAYQILVESDTASGGSSTTLENDTKDWPIDEYAADEVRFTIDAVDYRRAITSNTDTELTFASILPPTWRALTPYSLGNFVSPSIYNGHKYECTTAGISGTPPMFMEPVWPTVNGNTVIDGTVVWTCRAGAVSAGLVYEIWRYVGISDLSDRASRLLGVISAGTNLIGKVNPQSEAGAGQAPVGVSVTAASTETTPRLVARTPSTNP
ncbi:unnamed protein product [marine sediment metagenome]|uniref:Uncharacterized protein n=1 Tax=marine sediment metagenome TaxID=412755 RepID=X1QTY5_9ZZZZ